MTTVLSIGHSNHPAGAFLRLLQQHQVRCLVDVRSQPHSRRHPHFSRRALERTLRHADIAYVFLGVALGGRPVDPHCRRVDGSVDYRRRAQADEFLAGVARLCSLAERQTTAMMCAEEDPAGCHRRALVTPALLERGVDVVHIRAGGQLQREAGCEGQLPLFDGFG